MNKSLNITFVVLGVFFIIIILIGLGYYLSLSMGSSTSSYSKQSEDTTSNKAEESLESESFTLSEEQKQALSSFGVDPSTVPSSITTKQEACFVAELGLERVNEIKKGDIPSAIDFFKAKGCI